MLTVGAGVSTSSMSTVVFTVGQRDVRGDEDDQGKKTE